MNRIFFILVAILLFQPVFAIPETAAPLEPITVEEIHATSNESIQTKPAAADIERNSAQEPYDRSDLKDVIVPETKSEIANVVLMFLKTMFAVLISLVIIFLILLFVKRNYGEALIEKAQKTQKPQKAQKPQDDELAGDLKSPKSENEALKVFFNQTKNH